MSLRLKTKSHSTLLVGSQEYEYYRLSEVARQLGDITRLPKSLKVLLENLVRYLDNDTVVEEDIKALVDWQKQLMYHVKLPIDQQEFLCKILRGYQLLSI